MTDAVVELNLSTSDGPDIAVDRIANVDYQYIKLGIGDEGTFTRIGATNGLPITHAALTELAAAINSSQLDINLAASAINLQTVAVAATSGGTTFYKNLDVDESEDTVKASAGQIYWIQAINLSAVPLFLKFYNATVASVVVGTTVPDLTFPVPTQAATVNGSGFVLSVPNGIAFGTAITIAATTGFADADTGAPGANDLIVNMGYA